MQDSSENSTIYHEKCKIHQKIHPKIQKIHVSEKRPKMQSSSKYTNLYQKIQNLFEKIKSIRKCERAECKITSENLKLDHEIASSILAVITCHRIHSKRLNTL